MNSKTIVYVSGEILQIDAVKRCLLLYWQLNDAEKRSFLRMVAKYPSVSLSDIEAIEKSLDSDNGK